MRNWLIIYRIKNGIEVFCSSEALHNKRETKKLFMCNNNSVCSDTWRSRRKLSRSSAACCCFGDAVAEAAALVAELVHARTALGSTLKYRASIFTSVSPSRPIKSFLQKYFKTKIHPLGILHLVLGYDLAWLCHVSTQNASTRIPFSAISYLQNQLKFVTYLRACFDPDHRAWRVAGQNFPFL